jgi:hypothetical protein
MIARLPAFITALIFYYVSMHSFQVKAAQQYLSSLVYGKSYMINFTEKESEFWRSNNDGVMGGKSQGGLSYIDEHCIFSGDISLENNGGFSAVFKPVEILPRGLDVVEIDVSGDGSTYQLRMIVFIDGYRLSYKHDFNTTLGKRERIKFLLSDFKASFRGRTIEGAPKLTSEVIRETGFLLTKKIPGPFSLSLFTLEIYRNNHA